MKQTLVYGTDPEFFAIYKRDGQTYALPPIYFRENLGVKASDHPRHPVFFSMKKGGIFGKWHEDGAAFELAISPQKSWEELFDSVTEAIRLMNERIISHISASTGECEPSLVALPTVGWDVKRWMDAGMDFEMATRFGCDPDQNAFNTVARCEVEDASLHPYRYGGGHIHFSGIPGLADRPLPAVFSLAFTAGLAGVVSTSVPDLERMRTYLYGKAGKFRVQEYGKLFNGIPFTDKGIEYRTLSNSWTANKEAAKFIFEWAERGLTHLFQKNLIDELFKKLSKDVQTAILEYNQPLARELLAHIESKI
jgi:hypothetical protein